MFQCVYICGWMDGCAGMYVCVHMYMCVYVSTCVYTRRCVDMYPCMHACMRTTDLHYNEFYASTLAHFI